MILSTVSFIHALCFSIRVFFFQFIVRASDNRIPQRSSNSTVTVTVIRDSYLPEFQGLPYNVDVSENNYVGQSVFTVIARDRDIQVDTDICCILDA